MSQTTLLNCPANRVATGLTLLTLGIVAAGSLLALGSWALAGTRPADPGSTPSLADVYGEQFLMTDNQVADQARARQTAPADSTFSPLKSWEYTKINPSPSK